MLKCCTKDAQRRLCPAVLRPLVLLSRWSPVANGAVERGGMNREINDRSLQSLWRSS